MSGTRVRVYITSHDRFTLRVRGLDHMTRSTLGLTHVSCDPCVFRVNTCVTWLISLGFRIAVTWLYTLRVTSLITWLSTIRVGRLTQNTNHWISPHLLIQPSIHQPYQPTYIPHRLHLLVPTCITAFCHFSSYLANPATWQSPSFFILHFLPTYACVILALSFIPTTTLVHLLTQLLVQLFLHPRVHLSIKLLVHLVVDLCNKLLVNLRLNIIVEVCVTVLVDLSVNLIVNLSCHLST